jgi:hypothetical protein
MHIRNIAALKQFKNDIDIVQDISTHSIDLLLHTHNPPITSDPSKIFIGQLPRLLPEALGSKLFCKLHHCRFAYAVGEMANGISSKEMVIAAARAGFLGFFGAGGLLPEIVEDNIIAIKRTLDKPTMNWGCNLIHSPYEPRIESSVASILLQHDVRRVSASAFLKLTPSVVYYACKGLSVTADGSILRKNYLLKFLGLKSQNNLCHLPPL